MKFGIVECVALIREKRSKSKSCDAWLFELFRVMDSCIFMVACTN